MIRHRRLSLLVAPLLLAAMAACHRGAPPPMTVQEKEPQRAPPPTPPAPARVPEEGGEGTFALEEPFTSVAAAKLATSSDRILRGLAFHGLTRVDPTGRIEPELATRWEMLRGGAEWVIHLRPDTPFANGRYVEARHVVASWEKLISGADSRYAWLLDPVKGFDEIRSGKSAHAAGLILEDGLTFRILLERPVKDLLFRLAHPALGISAFGEDEQGVGPFEIWGTPKPQQVVVRSNPEYFRGLPHMDEIAFVRGEAARPALVSSGTLDAAVLAAGESGSPGSGGRIFAHAVSRAYLVGLNRSRSPFTRAETARAFLASLDRDGMRRAVAGEGGEIPVTLVASAAPGRKAPEPGKGLPPPSASLSALGRLEMLIPDGDKTASLLAARIQAGIGRAGGKGAIHPVSPADIGAALRRGDYQLFVLPFLPSTQDPLLCYEELMQWNRSIPDSLMLQARALEGEGDASALSALLEPLDSSLQAGGYLYPLVSLERRLVVRRGICGLRPDPAGMLDWTRIWKSTTAGEDCE